MQMMQTAATGNGNGTVIDWAGGLGTFAAWGTFDTATVTLQASFDSGTTWIPAGSDAALTEPGMANFKLPPCKLRAPVSGAGIEEISAGVESAT